MDDFDVNRNGADSVNIGLFLLLFVYLFIYLFIYFLLIS